jgi:dihydrofolate reductase
MELFVATDSKNGFSKDNKIPWDIPSDRKFFKKMTLGKTVIMGRKTFESMGRLLPNRKNIILTSRDLYIDGAIVCKTFEDAIHLADNICIIGGEQLYKSSLNYVTTIYKTVIDGVFDCDRFFPDIDDMFICIEKSENYFENGYSFRFEIWKKMIQHV